MLGDSSFLDDLFSEPKVEKGVPWEAKIIEGKYYVPLSQVADLLEQNKALPKVSKGIRVRCESLEQLNRINKMEDDK